MKALMIIFLTLAIAMTAHAQDTTVLQRIQQSVIDEPDDFSDKDVIMVSELPVAVREQLQSQEYHGWSVIRIWKKQMDSGLIYAIQLKSGNEKRKVKFDAQGNLLKESDRTSDGHRIRSKR